MLGLLALAAAAASTPADKAPFFPPTHHEIVDHIYMHQVPDPGADNLRLCVKDGKVCVLYHEPKSVGVTITIPFGKKPR